MSLNPFRADPAIASRVATLRADIGEEVGRDIAARAKDAALGRSDVEDLIARHRLTSVEDLMLLALPVAQRLARPPISRFFVGAVGLERETGGLLFGGNLEFPGSHPGHTVHAEGFLFTRAYLRGTTIAIMATGEAHPCAHCRQYISEFATSDDLVLIDPLGHRLTMADLYPWPFDPGYLGQSGAVPGQINWPALELAPNELPPAVAGELLRRGRQAWAPYSRCPTAVVLTLADGTLISGCGIESVAFNPGMSPLQAALIELAANGHDPGDIASAALATMVGGAVDYSNATTELLAAAALGSGITVTGWRMP